MSCTFIGKGFGFVGQSPYSAITPSVFLSTPTETYRLLTESLDMILTESGNNLRGE
jgi:hypothetical protein